MTVSSAALPTAAMASSPLVCQLPTLPPPSIQPSYVEQWKTISSSSQQTVFGAVWHGPHLVAATSAGDICIFHVPLGEQRHVEHEDTSEAADADGNLLDKRLPLLKIQVSRGVLYSIRFIEHNQRTFLFVSGDDGVWGYDWQHWLDLLAAAPTSATTPPEVLCHCRPYQSPLDSFTAEINGFDISGSHLFGAAGDARAYKWDMETQKLLATYPSAKGGYLHTLKVMPKNTVLIGGEDGYLGIWDGHHDKLVENIDVKSAMMDTSSSSLVHKVGNPAWDANTTNLWISHMESSPSNHWWNLCGGAETAKARAGGHVTSWHAPTRSLAAGCITRETPQFMAASSRGTLVTVADEGVVSYWAPCALQRTGRVWCSPPSSFAACIRQEDECLAVGGVGSHVDVFENLVDKAYSLSVD